jgi:N-acetyl-gamma-glutamyl-phosphate reductase
MKKIRVGIIGITGYTGEELLKKLVKHPKAELSALAGRTASPSRSMNQIYPGLADLLLTVEPYSEKTMAEKADVVFLALPHRVSFEIVPGLIAAGKKVIDLSADFRLDDGGVYEKWYGQKHTAAHLLEKAVYGLPEIYREKIKKASLVANPGCYPTSIILGLAPALKKGLVDLKTVIVDSKSGISGAGRKKTQEFFANEPGNFRPYNIGGAHRHIPEIEQELSKVAGKNIIITFTPNLIPIERGMVSVIYANLNNKTETESVLELYRNFYKGENFVRVLDKGKVPEVNKVANTNYCDIGLEVDSRTGRLVIVTAIDNLVKGAAGQAVQNMNIMCGFEETEGLL